ncbi:hypothetical protein [uncultured Draconibacterium sp.]|uniref:hypothetical protein n=1 Tax=uncultured Draconibacterium sp. TaxID=1573823 RepID=UPI0029C77465|nr:hypothetical protein [uncultured Draconibacterium sp.]
MDSFTLDLTKNMTFELIVSLVAIIVSVFALYFTGKQLRVLKWNQIDKTFYFMELWDNERILKLKKSVGKHYDYDKKNTD